MKINTIKNNIVMFRFSLFIFFATLLIAGCQATPIAQTQTVARRDGIEVVSASGRESARSIESVSAGDARQALLQHHLEFMAKRAGPPLIASNEARLLIDGPQTYDAIFSAMANARHAIDVEVYIFEDDKIGNAMADLMLRKQREGVRVRLIYDSVGSVKTPRSLFDSMRDAGIQVIEFNPVNPLAGKLFDLNHRDHRKLVIVDGAIAYTGGINISSVYAHGSGISRKSRTGGAESKSADKTRDNAGNDDNIANKDAKSKDGWRDTQIEIRGPAVAAISDLFNATWRAQGGAEAGGVGDIKNVAAHGDKFIRVIGSSSDDKANIIYSDLLAAIENAQRDVHITMSYFSPDAKMIAALRQAGQRGVEVQLILPGFSDWWPVLEAGRSHYSTLLEAGIVIYERKDVFLHAKTAVIDGVWSTVGSSNMDMRSFLHNNEVNAVVLGNDFGQAMEEMFAADRQQANRIEKEAWQQRSLLSRIKQSVARLFTYWL
ncbi:MAG TPA: phospholipase D-like domain-containing protein [Spongiibacteraceae bacterium]